jgi:phospholipid-binding lipoprotein MlaA
LLAAALVSLVIAAPARAAEPDSDAGAEVAADSEPEAEPDAAAEADPFFEDGFVAPQILDPLEPVNRPVFAANMAFDRVLIDPIARFYGWAVPAPVKRSIRGVFSNLNRPVVFVNQLLQLHPKGAAETLGRFALNSTLGMGGLFDPAAELGWDEHYADFGQTLGRYGVPPGIYHVLPLLGPSTTRDTVGTAVDLFLRIDTWVLPLTGQFILGGGFGITEREDKREEMEELRKSSLDFYAAVRSAFVQSRDKLIREARRDP